MIFLTVYFFINFDDYLILKILMHTLLEMTIISQGLHWKLGMFS